MRRKAFAVAGGFVLAAVLIAACSSSSSNSGGDSGPKTMTDPLVIETSDATRAELGVKLWGVRLDTDGTMAVHGYDGANNAIVEIRQSNFATDEWQSTVTMSVAGLGANAKMTSRIESTPSFSESPDEPATLDFTMMEN